MSIYEDEGSDNGSQRSDGSQPNQKTSKNNPNDHQTTKGKVRQGYTSNALRSSGRPSAMMMRYDIDSNNVQDGMEFDTSNPAGFGRDPGSNSGSPPYNPASPDYSHTVGVPDFSHHATPTEHNPPVADYYGRARTYMTSGKFSSPVPRKSLPQKYENTPMKKDKQPYPIHTSQSSAIRPERQTRGRPRTATGAQKPLPRPNTSYVYEIDDNGEEDQFLLLQQDRRQNYITCMLQNRNASSISPPHGHITYRPPTRESMQSESLFVSQQPHNPRQEMEHMRQSMAVSVSPTHHNGMDRTSPQDSTQSMSYRPYKSQPRKYGDYSMVITEKGDSAHDSDHNNNSSAYSRGREYDDERFEEIDNSSSSGQQLGNEHGHPRRPHRVSKNRNARDAPRKAVSTSSNSVSPPRQETSIRGKRTGMIYSIDKKLRPSRYSGTDEIPYYINRDPVMVPASEVSNAQMIKRGVSPTGDGYVPKRAYGVTDPENLEIVRMKEEENLSFAEIAKRLNAERVRTGRKPSLTACGVTSRYTRCAPVVFAANGIEFVPLSQRGGRNRPNPIFRGDNRVGWDDEMNEELVRIEKEFMANKWEHIASTFNNNMNTNITAAEAASRYAHI